MKVEKQKITSLLRARLIFGIFLLFSFCQNTLPVFANTYGSSTFGVGQFNFGANTSNAKNSTSAPTSPTCTLQTPGSAPQLYAVIPQSGNSVILYFTNAGNPVDHYALTFGFKSGNYLYGQDNIGSQGTRSYTVNNLSPRTTYVFKIRGGNGCATGDWSNEISATTLSPVSLNHLSATVNTVNINSNSPASISTTQVASSESSVVKTPTTSTSSGLALIVKVMDKNQKPIKGAKVTLHSIPQETLTNEYGLATFSNVEKGAHQLLITYNSFTGQQNINLNNDMTLTMVVSEQKVIFSSIAISFVAGLLIGVVILIVFISIFLRIKRNRKNHEQN